MTVAALLLLVAIGLAAVDQRPNVVSVRVPPVRLPAATSFIDEAGNIVRLESFRGKILFVSFFSTQGAGGGSCTAVAGKFLYLQRHLPARGYRLLQITRDPAHDSPPRLHAYARQFGADSRVWSFLTGDARQIAALVRTLRAAKPRGASLDEALYVVDGTGQVAGKIAPSDWSPEDALTLARSIGAQR